MATLLISTLDDRSVQYTVDGHLVVEVDHHTDGDEAMDKIDSAMRTMAELLMLDIAETEEGTEESVDEED